MSVTTWGWLVIACPLAGTTLIALGWPVLAGRGRAAGWIGTLAIAASSRASHVLCGPPASPAVT